MSSVLPLVETLDDVQRLIDGGVYEGLTLDYKAELWANNKEIVKDVSSFANTEGGTIVIGVECRRSVPTKIGWIEQEGTEEKIQNIAATAISPPLKGINVSEFPNPGDHIKSVLVINIPKSFDSPHMANERYYKRLGSTSRAMNHGEVMNAMLGVGRLEALRFEVSQNLELAENTRNFVSRIYDMYSGGTPLEDREEIIFIPFLTDGWSAVVSGGFMFAFPERVVQALMDSYAKIHVLNSFFDSIKSNTHVVVHTMMDQSGVKQLPKYSLALLLHTKLPELKRSLEQLQTALVDL